MQLLNGALNKCIEQACSCGVRRSDLSGSGSRAVWGLGFGFRVINPKTLNPKPIWAVGSSTSS